MTYEVLLSVVKVRKNDKTKEGKVVEVLSEDELFASYDKQEAMEKANDLYNKMRRNV